MLSEWLQQLAFRDALPASPALATEYSNPKVSLAEKFRLDREAYTETKTPFVDRVLFEPSMGEESET